MVNYKQGDLIEVRFSGKTKKGILMPSTKTTLVLKLISGYNIGIEKKKIKKVKLVEKRKKVTKKQKIKTKKGLPTILILHTGGTIASKVDYETGAVSAKFSPEDLVSMFPELSKIANIKSKLVAQMYSEDMRFAHYNLLAKEISKNLKVKGIIISHGTDTIYCTAAALAFILENIPIPVILVGAQRSSDRGSSDAALNLISAANFITKSNFQGVGLCMHSSIADKSCFILPACKTRKLHTSRRDAFKPVNDKPIAQINGKNITFFKPQEKITEKFKLKPIKPSLKIGLLKIHPNMYVKQLDIYKSFNGLIIEGSGLGHFPINKIDKFTQEHLKIYNKLKQLSKKMPVIMTSQCLFGAVNMKVYSTGRKLIDLGILGTHTDILPEIAFIKLAWLISNHKKDLKDLWYKNLRGELNKRIEPDQYLE